MALRTIVLGWFYVLLRVFVFFFFNDTATTEIYTLSLHDALPISQLPGAVVSRDAAEAHRPGLHSPDAGAEGVRLAHRARDDFLEVHAHVREEMFGQVAAMEADRLVGVFAVVVVPVE